MQVTARRAENWCASHGDAPYFETSARDATNVDLVFQTAARLALQQLGPQSDKQTEVIRITRRPSQLQQRPDGSEDDEEAKTGANSGVSSRCC